MTNTPMTLERHVAIRNALIRIGFVPTACRESQVAKSPERDEVDVAKSGFTSEAAYKAYLAKQNQTPARNY